MRAKQTISHALLAGGLLCLAAAPVEAQNRSDSQPEATSQDFVLTTQFLEAAEAQKWGEAIELFRTLEREYPQAVAQDARLRLIFATALISEKELDAAAKNFETILEGQEDHVDALYHLAFIRAQGDKQDKERAKEHLVQAARAGRLVLRDLESGTKETKKVFEPFLAQPDFVLRIMHASNEFAAPTTLSRNPFASPLRRGTDEVVDDPQDQLFAQRQRELEERIEQLFEQIVQLAEDRQVEELVGRFTELRALMTEFGQAGTDEVKKKLEKYNQRLQDLGEVRLSIKLQVYINEGNQHLRAMADAIRNEEYTVALEHFVRIEDIVADMRDEEREVFHRNADALFLRGQALAERARRLKRISEFKLVITGVVVAPPDSDEPDSAIINDRIYEESDTIMDDKTEEEIDGLRIVKIARSTVTFRFEDTEFVRELKASAP